MTDRELLGLAAKAAGLSIDKSETNGGGRGNTGFDSCGNAMLDWHNNVRWNPLADDGDALRLAVTLGLRIGSSSFTTLYVDRGSNVFVAESSGSDPLAATRRAIVRAAAEIGKAMP